MSRRPHVIIEALQVRRNPAGTGRGIMDLCAALAAVDRGFDFTVLTSEREIFSALEERPGWRIHECAVARGNVLKKALYTQLGLPGLVRRLRGDLLHCMQFLVPLRCACPQVATVHDLAWLLYPATIGEPRRSYYRWLVPRSLARVEAIVVNSRSTAEETARHFPQAAEKIHVTTHGTPSWALDMMGQDSPDHRRRPYFLFVGTMEPRKNLPRLLDAYEDFLASDQAAGASPGEVPGLIFVGARGWKESGLRARMDRLRDRGCLEVLDYCDTEMLWGLYRHARALVFPSLHEGFGLPILEAMAAATPVMTSNRAGTAEVAGDGALLVDPENTGEIAAGLASLAFDRELRNSLAAGGPGRARGWTWGRTADLTEAVYRQVLEG